MSGFGVPETADNDQDGKQGRVLVGRTGWLVLFEVFGKMWENRRVLRVPCEKRLASGRWSAILEHVLRLGQIQRTVNQSGKKDQSDISDIPTVEM
jgi:hypothetical protein